MNKRTRTMSDMEDVYVDNEEEEEMKRGEAKTKLSSLEEMNDIYNRKDDADFVKDDLKKAHIKRLKFYGDPDKTPYVQVLSANIAKEPDNLHRIGEFSFIAKIQLPSEVIKDVAQHIPHELLWDATGYVVLKKEANAAQRDVADPQIKYTIALYSEHLWDGTLYSWNTLHPVWDVKYPGGYPGSESVVHVERLAKIGDLITEKMKEPNTIFCTQEMCEDLAEAVISAPRIQKFANYYDGKTPHKPNQLGLVNLAESQTIFGPIENFHRSGGSTFTHFSGSHSNGYVIGTIETNGAKIAFISVHLSWGAVKRNIELAKVKLEIQKLLLDGYSSVLICGDFNTSLYNITRKLTMNGVPIKFTEPRWITRPTSKLEDDKRIDHIILFGHGRIGHFAVEEGSELLSDHKLVYAQLFL